MTASPTDPRVRARAARAVRPASARRTTSSAAGWPTATPEVCLAVADEQTAGRGRDGRTWIAPAGRGAAPARSASGRPGSRRTAPGGWPRSSRLAMADAAEEVAGLPAGHDPPEVAERPRRRGRRARRSAAGPSASSAGVLGETDGLGTTDPRAVVGIGVNVDWPAGDFPADLADVDDVAAELSGGPADRPRASSSTRFLDAARAAASSALRARRASTPPAGPTAS